MTATLSRPPVGLSPAALTSVQALRDSLVKFTGDDAQQMRKAGILPEDVSVELLGGLFVYRDCGSSSGEPGVPGIEHDFVVRRLGKLDRGVDSVDRRLVTQLTLRLAEDYSPAPDAMILRGPETDYTGRQPTAADVLCLVEVADTSYARGAGDKLNACARGGVPQYVIVNLRDRTAEVYADPDPVAGTYPPPLVVQAGGSLSLHVGDGRTVDVLLAALLP